MVLKQTRFDNGSERRREYDIACGRCGADEASGERREEIGLVAVLFVGNVVEGGLSNGLEEVCTQLTQPARMELLFPARDLVLSPVPCRPTKMTKWWWPIRVGSRQFVAERRIGVE